MSKEMDGPGLKTQRVSQYNRLLPYADILEKESTQQLAEIKAQFGRTVQLRDIKIGASHWAGQLSKYIRLYGHKYSKEDHIAFVKLLYELTTIPDLEFSLVQKFVQLLFTLLKKKELLSRDDLTLPWRPLYELLDAVVYSQYEHHGLILLPSNIESVLKNLVKACRIYFSVESTQEMLNEWRPLMCPFDITMMKAMYFFELFLPTKLPPENHEQGFRLWFDEFVELWDSCQNFPSWEGSLVSLFARLAENNIGYIDWEPLVPKIFTRVLRSFNLPVGSAKIQVGRPNNSSYEIQSVVTWIASMMGGGSCTQQHITKLFRALESFYHPSNQGRWIAKLIRLMFKMPRAVVHRLTRERYLKTWEPEVPESHRLKDSDVTEFVESMKPVVFLAMFSKLGSHDSSVALDQLALLRPELIIPPLLDRTYPAMETLTEPHRLIACLNCTVSVARSMLNNQRWYPQGRSHVLPLLNLSLPGIDPNDVRKCLTTFQLVSTLASLVPIVDCSAAINLRSDLSEEEKELCSASAQFEDFVLLFMDRIFGLIESSSSEHTRSDSLSNDRLNQEEAMLEVGLLSTFNAIMQQSSDAIYEEALGKLYRFVTSSVLEIRVAGRFTADLCRAVVKVRPDKALKKFIPHFTGSLLSRLSSEDLTKEERLDNEFLWNLKLLSETVRCDGQCLLPYQEQLMSVLRGTLHLKCKDGADLAGNLLRYTLKAVTLIFTMDYRSTATGWDQPLDQHLPIREWGKPGDLKDLQIKWHVPSSEEIAFATALLEAFLLPELDSIKQHTQEEFLLREELQQSLAIVGHCVNGAGSALPMWEGEQIKLIDSIIELKRFKNTASTDEKGILINGQNVRLLIVNTLRPLLGQILEKSEDDTKSLLKIIQVYSTVLFHNGTQKEDFDGRWKSLHIVKKSMENKFLGKKRHIRAVLVDRVQLQHELRIINRTAKVFSADHKDLFYDLFRLSISHYSEVRKSAQGVLSHGFNLYAYSYRALLDDIIACLANDPSIEHHQFKGALYLVMGGHKRSLVTKRSWEVITRVWPALIKAQHSEKPSILRIIDDIADKLHKNVEATEIIIKVHQKLLTTAQLLWQDSELKPSYPPVSDEELEYGRLEEEKRNAEAFGAYSHLIDVLVELIETGNLRWKFHQLGMEMLGLLGRHDQKFPEKAVRLFVSNLVHDSLQVRKLCVSAVSAILKLQKRKHKMQQVDPFYMSRTGPPMSVNDMHPGDRADNRWHCYNCNEMLDTKEKWDNCVFVEKTHWGYYSWPSSMKVYAPAEEQPPLGRSIDQLSPEEKVIYEHFSDPSFIEKLLGFLTLEEHKGKDKFHSRHFTLFKGLFRNFDDAFLEVLKPHVETMVADSKHDTHECNQRCAAEIISGLVRGSKHWTYKKMESMWEWLIPVLKTALNNMTVESVGDWGTCFATAAESRDPRKLAPMLEMLMENPLRGDGGSFGDSSRLYTLQGALAQQEWRVSTILHRLLHYLEPNLAHNYKNVRDRLGSVLVNVFLYDFKLPRGNPTNCPRVGDFIKTVIPQLEVLQHVEYSGNNHKINHGIVLEPVAMEIDRDADVTKADPLAECAESGQVQLQMMETAPGSSSTNTECGVVETVLTTDNSKIKPLHNREDEKRKSAIRLLKSVIKWIQGSFSRMLNCAPAEIFQFLPIVCIYESDITDEELRHDCMVTLACMSQTLLTPEILPTVMEIIKQVAGSRSWHARAAILGYLQVMVFCNLFLLQSDAIVQEMQEIVLKLLCDDQVEVREMAAVTLGGFLHCGYMTMDTAMMTQFEKLGSTKIKRKQRQELINPEKLIQRHAGVLGLSACVQAFPYDVPTFIPQILMDLSDHLDDPQPIQLTVKKTLSNFRRTHHDNWQDHKQKFTDDQLVVLTDLLVSPNYYA